MNTLILLTALTAPNQCAPFHHKTYFPAYHAPAVKVVEKIVVKEIPVAVYAPLAVAVQYYGGAYVPPAHVPAPAAPTVNPAAPSDTQKILELLQGMDARLKAVEGKVGTPAPAAPSKPKDPFNPGTSNLEAPKPSVVSIFKNKCSQCHDAKTSMEKGAGFTLLEGDAIATLSLKEQKKMTFHILKGTMPKKPVEALNEVELEAVLAYIDSMK